MEPAEFQGVLPALILTHAKLILSSEPFFASALPIALWEEGGEGERKSFYTNTSIIQCKALPGSFYVAKVGLNWLCRPGLLGSALPDLPSYFSVVKTLIEAI